MLNTIICISEFGTKLVAGISGLVFAIVILACVFAGKKKQSKPYYPDAKIGKNGEQKDIPDRKKDKKSKKAKGKEDTIENSETATKSENEAADNADQQNSNN